MDNISEKVDDLINKCNKCGFCQANCLVYKTTFNEFHAARGRVQLVKKLLDGIVEIDDDYEKILNSCLLCKECTLSCPSGVDPPEIIRSSRITLFERKFFPSTKNVIIKTLANSKWRERSFYLAGFMKNTLIDKQNIFTSYKNINIKSINIDKKSFIGQIKKKKLSPLKKSKTAFFVGCFINHTLTDTGHNILKIFKSNNIDLVVPYDQQCCGTPSYVYGDIKTTKDLAKKNISVFDSFDTIITACATCGSMLKSEYNKLFGDDPDLSDKAKKFSKKIYDFSEFLVKYTNPAFKNQNVSGCTVTYHDGCHMSRYQAVTEEPRILLKKTFNNNYVELEEADRCCGAAGLFQLYNADIAKNISARKIENIENSGADIVAVSCPACLFRIQGYIDFANLNKKVVHIADLIAKNYE